MNGVPLEQTWRGVGGGGGVGVLVFPNRSTEISVAIKGKSYGLQRVKNTEMN